MLSVLFLFYFVLFHLHPPISLLSKYLRTILILNKIQNTRDELRIVFFRRIAKTNSTAMVPRRQYLQLYHCNNVPCCEVLEGIIMLFWTSVTWLALVGHLVLHILHYVEVWKHKSIKAFLQSNRCYFRWQSSMSGEMQYINIWKNYEPNALD